MKISDKRKAGEILGREGLSKKIIEIGKSIANGSYKNAIIEGGRISVLIDACSYDDYWGEKACIGKYSQESKLGYIIKKAGK